MENIVESLFGLSPWQVQQQQNAGMDAYASNQASKSLLQRSSENYGRAGGMFAQAGAEAMGMVNPQVEQAKQRQAMLGGLEPNAESIRQRALQISDPKLKFQLLAYANQLDEKEQAKKLAAAQLKNAIDPSAKPARKDFTAESWKVYERTGKQSDLVEAANAPKIEAGKTRTYQKGQDSITEELQADGTWKQLGIGPKFSKSVINVGTGVDQGSDTFEPDVVDFYAKQALMTGDQTWRTGLGRSKDGVKLIIAVDKRIPKMASEVGMTAEEASNNKQMFGARLKAIKDFGTGQQGQMVNSFNTAIAHLDTLKDLGEALKNKDTQVINKVGNTVKEWFGNADVTNLDTAKQIVGAEIIKAIVARGGGVDERKEAANRISRISSPDQLVGYINTTQELLAGQLYSLENQYKTTTKQNDFGDKLLPRSKDALARLRKTSTSNVSQIPTENTTAVSVSNW